MQQSEIEYLDGEFTVLETEPSEIAELVGLIGEPAVVDETTSNLRYRNKYPRVYNLVSKAVEELGFKRAVKETKLLKDGTSKDVLVSSNDHLRDFLKADEANRVKLQELFDTIAPAQPLYVKGERTAGGGKISQAALDAANGVFAMGDEKVEQVASAIEAQIPGYKIGRDAEGSATPESIARGIAALQRHIQAQAKKQSAALLGLGK